MLLGKEVIIHSGNFGKFLAPRDPNLQGHHGLVPRNYNQVPRGAYPWASATDFPLVPDGEITNRIRDKTANKEWLSDLRMISGPNDGMIPSRDQNGKGYCWAHSGTSAHLLVRALMHEPYADLSAYAIACIIKSYRDEGGWGAQGVDWQVQNGCPTSATWAQQSMSRSNDNAAMRAEAAKRKITGQWADLNAAQYDRNLTWKQLVTLMISDCPTVVDFNWWSHSVCACALVDGASLRGQVRNDAGKLLQLTDFDLAMAMNDPVTAGIALRIWNSWGDSWSDNGTGLLTGNKAVPDGAVGVQTVMAA